MILQRIHRPGCCYVGPCEEEAYSHKQSPLGLLLHSDRANRRKRSRDSILWFRVQADLALVHRYSSLVFGCLWAAIFFLALFGVILAGHIFFLLISGVALVLARGVFAWSSRRLLLLALLLWRFISIFICVADFFLPFGLTALLGIVVVGCFSTRVVRPQVPARRNCHGSGTDHPSQRLVD